MGKIDWTDPEEVRQYYRKYREKNKEKIKECNKKYYAKNKEKILERYAENKEKLQKYKREYNRKRRERAIDKLGGKCVVCGWTDKRALVFDHIHGGGNKDREKKGGQYALITWILEAPLEEVEKKIQILCENHNRIKERERRRFNQN